MLELSEPDELDDLPAITPENAPDFFWPFLGPEFRQSPQGVATLERLASLYDEHRGPSRRTLRWQRQAITTFDNWPRLGEISTDALVVHPSQDTKPLETSEAFARALGRGELRVVPGAGHDLRWEMPRVSAEIILEFLGRSPSTETGPPGEGRVVHGRRGARR
jgi:pimeloyl-ACP methyl ester carboxylesterase